MKKRLKVLHEKLNKNKEKKEDSHAVRWAKKGGLKDERVRRRATCAHGEMSSTLLGRAE
jgi:hypothetical protein